MRERKDILHDLVCYEGSIEKLCDELKNFPWDTEESFMTIEQSHVHSVLIKALNKKINFADLEEWADAIEVRDDLEFRNDFLREIINEIANPVLFGELNVEKVKFFVKNLSER